tara:strand:- start:46231 stop:47022 length:792 start_codon:yes stop_codon:yes gene_type:complete
MVNKLTILNTQYFSFGSILERLSYQRSCYLCDETTKEHAYFCDDCDLDLPKLTTKCSNCCLPVSLETKDAFTGKLLCGECISSPPSFSQTVCIFEYQFPINQIIKRIKYSSQRYWIRPLSHLLIVEVIDAYQHTNHLAWPDMLIPIPIHKSKTKVRGYNQAELIAQRLAKKLHIPLAKKILIKTKSTETQVQLNKLERMKNLQGSLSISTKYFNSNSLKDKHIALIDDVMTTKATCELASRLLLEAGATQVDVWCLARTPKRI